MENRTEKIIDDLFRYPLERLADSEIDALYGSDIKAMARLIGRVQSKRKAANLAVAMVRLAGMAALRVVDAVDCMVTNFMDVALPMSSACATRGLSAGGAQRGVTAGAERIEAVKAGDGANLKLAMEEVAGKYDVRIRLEDAVTGSRLSPMDLYVEDRQSGETLLEKRTFSSGEALLRGVEPGEYWIEADSGDKGAEMALKVEGAGR